MKKTLLFWLVFLGLISLAVSQNYSGELEQSLNKYYQQNQVVPNPPLLEDNLVKKVYLGIAGRIPTEEEYLTYKKSKDPQKKQKLVKQLVYSEDFVSNYYNYWADLLRTRERLNQTQYVSGLNYISWIKDSFRKNVPYNKWVQSLLLSEGSYYENGATGYFLRDQGMGNDNLIGTMKIFAGTDVSCAQCHDDPFQSWTQYQFHESTAFFIQYDLREDNKSKTQKFKEIRAETQKMIDSQSADAEKAKKRNVANQVNQFLQASLVGVYESPKKEMRLPDNYKYPDAKPKDIVPPKVLFEESPSASATRRAQFTDWLTSPTNPTFTKNAVNRLWKMVFGEALIADLNHIQDKEAINKELIDLLCRDFVKMKYDTKMFLEMLYNSSLYCRTYYDGNKQEWKMQGPVRRRLSAEQIWDSVLTASIPNINYVHPEELSSEYNQIFHFDLANLNSEKTLKLIKEIQELGKNRKINAKVYKGYQLVRASEINDEKQQAAQLLIHMGRSERELIGNSSRDGSVTQVILFVNGILPEIVTQKDSVLMIKLKDKSKQEQIDIIFRTLLTRTPSMAERDFYTKYSVEDIIWACLNSHEFKFLGA